MEKYKEGWYWITNPQEGDVWYPIFIREHDFLLDGKSRPLSQLLCLIVKPAIMPK